MGICITTKDTLDIDYREIRRKEKYEPIVLDIMNDSKITFPSHYCLFEKQDNGEADFYDVNNSDLKYDAKLLFENEMCQALNKGRLEDFKNELMNLVSIDYQTQMDIGPKESVLYKEMKKRIESLKEDEIGILFLPFPVLPSSSDSIFSDFCSDQFDWCFREMKIKKAVYLIALNIFGQIVCKQLAGNSKTEYLENNYFDDLLKTEIIDWQTKNS